jgi:hypothetical protein
MKSLLSRLALKRAFGLVIDDQQVSLSVAAVAP